MFSRALFGLVFFVFVCVSSLPGAVPDVAGWVESAFNGAPIKPTPPGPSLVLRHQDYGQLQVNKSVMETPLAIGQQTFARGLGTHANSEIVVSFPPGSVTAFNALGGVDGLGTRMGSVDFVIDYGGSNVFYSKTLRGGDEAMPIHLPVPSNIGQLALKVDTTPDGPSFDHADWAMAQLVQSNGSVLWLDDLVAQSAGAFWPSNIIPFSFVYNNESSSNTLRNWRRTDVARSSGGSNTWSITWTDGASDLQVTADVTAFADFPAVEWVLRFTNTGASDLPMLENVQVLDAALPAAPQQNVILDQINGDDASERSFVPTERALKTGETVSLAPAGGRPSNYTFPIFDIQQGSRGVFTAIGWTGQWAAQLRRGTNGATHVQAGMELTHLRLRAHEGIRTPRILLMPWTGDRMDAHNEFRRLLLAHYLPKIDGRAPYCAIAAQSFNQGPPNWATVPGQLRCAQINRDLGCDTLWMDAGWFQGGFPNGTGNWFTSAAFPHGMGAIGEKCEELGLKFLMWYEPERVCDNTQIANEHAAFVLPVNKKPGTGGLFNLGEPAARRWLTDLIIREIGEYHMHTYRNDFNMDPLPFWRQNDAPDRQGITEIRYVEGLYEWWDEMRARFPEMYLDDCASGGRRIDLETIKRSLVQTRSDAAVAPGRADWNQSQTYGLNLFLPVHATIGWETGTYECRSTATEGFCAEWDILDPKFPMAQAKADIGEIRENQKYWRGDYYPLTPWTMDSDRWVAWQLHRADLDAGIILAFRHIDSPYSALQVHLRGINPEKVYNVDFINEAREHMRSEMKGSQLTDVTIPIAKPHESLLVRYAEKGK